MGTEVLIQQEHHHQPSGASRSLTEIFILLLNNAIQSRHVFSDARSSLRYNKLSLKSTINDDDRLSLIPLDESSRSNDVGGDVMTPEWVNIVDEVQYEIHRVQTRIKELKEIQQKHINTPNFSDEKSHEENAIELATSEITRMLSHCHKLCKVSNVLFQLIQNTGPPTFRDVNLRKNVIVSLAQCLQNPTSDFRSSQSAYLGQIQNRRDNCEKFFDEQFSAGFVSSKMLPNFDADFPSQISSDQQLSMKQLHVLHENTAMAKEREREISNVTKSIIEVNELFKDLASLIVDQGAILDRIDYNIEQTGVKTKSAYKSVKKAEEYQRRNRKMWCIIVLSITVTVLLILLVPLFSKNFYNIIQIFENSINQLIH